MTCPALTDRPAPATFLGMGQTKAATTGKRAALATHIGEPHGQDARTRRLTPFKGKRVLIMGLGRFGGGVGVTRWLASQGALVTVTDQASAESLTESVEAVADLRVTLHLGGHESSDLDQADLVIVNPAVVKSKSPFFQEVVRRSLPWTTEMNLFCQRCPAPVIGVTGSFGKSTTCAMLAEALRACVGPPHLEAETTRAGRSITRCETNEHHGPLLKSSGTRFTAVHLGGNIGNSLLIELPNIKRTDIVVLEMSNAQLEDLPQIGWVPSVAAITNLWPHHLDRYPTPADYFAAKLNIIGPREVRARTGGIGIQPVVCGTDLCGTGLQPVSRRTLKGAALPKEGGSQETGGRIPQTVIFGDLCPEAEQMLFQRLGATPMPGKDAAPGLGGTGSLLPVCRPATPIELRIPGKHNQANAACVLTVCRAMGFDEETTRSALASFSGLPHRIQFVRTIDGVDYFNDSKSTAPSATMVAVESFDRPIVAMIGGQKKDVALSAFCETLVRSCRAVVCVGECGASFAQAVRSVAAGETHARRTVVHRVQRLEDGLQLARHEARPGDVVLFSPGAPSFDGYANFTQRGDHFMRIVQSL